MSNNSEYMKENDNTELENICPYLGLYGDPSTSYAFANHRNFCHRIKLNQTISLAHQTRFCLTAEYTSCPIFQSPNENSPARSIDSELKQKNVTAIPIRFWIISLLVLIILIIALIIYNLFNKRFISSFETNSSTNSLLLSSEEVPTSTGFLTSTANGHSSVVSTPQITKSKFPILTYAPSPTHTPILSSTPTIMSIPTTSSPTPGPNLGVKFGPDSRFVLHKIKQGEALSLVAQTYQTSVEVLRTINNVVPGASLWADTVIVVMPGQLDTNNLPRFKVIQLEEPTDINQISTEHKVSVEELKYFNQLGDSNNIPAGRWLIIPIVK